MQNKTNNQLNFLLITTTRKDLNSKNTTFDTRHPVYLYDATDNYYDIRIQVMPFIFFLSSLDDTGLESIHNCNLDKKMGNEILDRQMIIFEKEDPSQKIFDIRYSSLGTCFTIKIIGTSQYVIYKETTIVKFHNNIKCKMFGNQPILSNLATNKFKIKNNKFLSFISTVLNGRFKKENVSSVIATIFYSISPKSPKAQRNDFLKHINPNNTLEGVFEQVGGTLCVYKGYGGFAYNGIPCIGFVWFHNNFDLIMNLSSTIELDATFTILKPFVFSIPQLIYRNTGFPLALIVGPSESSDFYSLFFESLKVLDLNNDIFSEFIQKSYLTDQHPSFKKLGKKYNLSIYHCYVHLIRNCGAKSALSLIIREMLFCTSEEEFKKNKKKWKSLFNELTKDTRSSALRHQKLFENIINCKPKYAPLFMRMNDSVPTTTNHSESFHHCLNESVSHTTTKMMTRIALLAQRIKDRLINVNESILRNFKNYVKDLKKKANDHVHAHPEDADKFSCSSCSCPNYLYYSLLFGDDVPCIHQIFNNKWNQPKVWHRWFDGKQIVLNNIQTELAVKELDQVLNFEEEEKNETSGENGISEKVDIIEPNKYDEKYAQLIYECLHQLKAVMSIDYVEVAAIAMQVQESMLNDPKLLEEKERSPDHFYTLMQIRIWKKAYIKKNMLSLF